MTSVARFSSTKEAPEALECSCCGRECTKGYLINGRPYGDKCGANLLGLTVKALSKAADKGNTQVTIVNSDDIMAAAKQHLSVNKMAYACHLRASAKQIKPLVDQGLLVKVNHPNFGMIYLLPNMEVPKVHTF